MMRINVFSVKQVKERGGLYDLDNRILRCPEDAYNIVESVLKLSESANEIFGIISLNTKNAVAGVHVISIGSVNAAIVHPREVYKAAILNNASSIVCFHNHPSGICTPSHEDLILTERLMESGRILGIDLLDHIIVGNGYLSLKDNGDMRDM